MTRPSRLASVKKWIGSYKGKNLVKGYARWFGVDWLCALHELKLAGVSFTEEDEKRIVRAYEQSKEDKARRKRNALPKEASLYDSDEHFSFIVGYTPNGVPHKKEQDELDTDSNLLPF